MALGAFVSTRVALGNPVIWIPTEGTTLTAGSEVTVMVQDSSYATPIQETSLSIGLSPCTETSCPGPDTSVLYLLYTGAFDPQRPSSPVNYDPGSYAFQNFTVTVPAEAESGSYTLGVLHSYWGESVRFIVSSRFTEELIFVLCFCFLNCRLFRCTSPRLTSPL
ncbi:hypothetical protein EV368DRAFT_52506 [Lentinula lateritia]|nr:hypothetical protein EV368DRAFT_52506 [Lentinula lateritia]